MALPDHWRATVPSVDDCSRTAPPPPSRVAGIDRNQWLAWPGITGWNGSESVAGLRRNTQRNLRDRRAVARYAGLTGSPDESGSKRREKGLAKAGNARVRRGLVQLAWRFLLFQKDSALTQWYRTRTRVQGVRKTVLIVALARKLLIALWRMVTAGEVPHGVVLRAAA